MQQLLFDTVTDAHRKQRQQLTLEKDRRKEHHKQIVRKEQYKKDKDKYDHLSSEMKRTLTAMDSLSTILFAIGSQAEALKKVMQYRIEEKLKDTTGSKNGLNVRKHIMSISNMLFKQIVQAAKDSLTDPDVYLPQVIHYVELDENSKIKKAPLRFDSDIFVTQAQEDLFNVDFRKWLLKNGYEENKTGQVVNVQTQAVIKKEAFEALRDDPANGLTRYLKDEWKMENVKQEKARVEAPKVEPAPKKEAKKRDRDESPDDAQDEAEDHAPRPGQR